MKLKFLVLLILFISTTTLASEKIILQESDSYWGHPLIVKGSHIYGGTPDAASLDDLVKDNPKALEYAQEYAHYRNAFWITFVPWMGALVLAVVTQDPTTGWISLGVGVAATIPLIHFESRSRYFLLKAINTYNGDDKETQSKLDLGLQVVSREPGLGLSFKF